MPEPAPTTLTLRQIAVACKVSRNTALRWVTRDGLESHFDGNKLVVYLTDFNLWLRRHHPDMLPVWGVYCQAPLASVIPQG